MNTVKTCLTALLSRGSTERAKLDHSSNDLHPRSVILVPSPSQAGFVRQDRRLIWSWQHGSQGGLVPKTALASSADEIRLMKSQAPCTEDMA